MLQLSKTKRFEADLRRAFRHGLSPDDWGHLEYLFQKGGMLPEEYDEHRLRDNWHGHWDCHLAGDLVVIYRRSPKRINFVRMGTHDELFRHRKQKGFWRWFFG
jgi:mRNA interferase YafQ